MKKHPPSQPSPAEGGRGVLSWFSELHKKPCELGAALHDFKKEPTKKTENLDCRSREYLTQTEIDKLRKVVELLKINVR